MLPYADAASQKPDTTRTAEEPRNDNPRRTEKALSFVSRRFLPGFLASLAIGGCAEEKVETAQTIATRTRQATA